MALQQCQASRRRQVNHTQPSHAAPSSLLLRFSSTTCMHYSLWLPAYTRFSPRCLMPLYLTIIFLISALQAYICRFLVCFACTSCCLPWTEISPPPSSHQIDGRAVVVHVVVPLTCIFCTERDGIGDCFIRDCS